MRTISELRKAQYWCRNPVCLSVCPSVCPSVCLSLCRRAGIVLQVSAVDDERRTMSCITVNVLQTKVDAQCD